MTRKRKRSDLATDEDLDDEDFAVLKACVLAIPAVQKRVDVLVGIKNKSKEEDAKIPRGWRSCWHPDWGEFYYFKVDEKKQACGPATWVRPTNQAPITARLEEETEKLFISQCAFLCTGVHM